MNVTIGTYEVGEENATQVVALSTGQEYVFTIVDKFGDGLVRKQENVFLHDDYCHQNSNLFSR